MHDLWHGTPPILYIVFCTIYSYTIVRWRIFSYSVSMIRGLLMDSNHLILGSNLLYIDTKFYLNFKEDEYWKWDRPIHSKNSCLYLSVWNEKNANLNMYNNHNLPKLYILNKSLVITLSFLERIIQLITLKISLELLKCLIDFTEKAPIIIL